MFIASLFRLLCCWRLRYRQRAELAVLCELDFNFRELGVSATTAATESALWPWQAWSVVWQRAGADRRARCHPPDPATGTHCLGLEQPERRPQQ